MTAPTLSIVIPTLNAASCWPGCLAVLQQAQAFWGEELEVLVIDGGSEDGCAELVAESGFRLLKSTAGRGQQLALGGRIARGEWLLFLHVDSQLPQGWCADIQAWMGQPQAIHKAAYFTLAFDSKSLGARRLERVVRWRNDWLSLPYGDQGLLLSSQLYKHSGGYPDQKLMEDVALVRRLRQKRSGQRVKLQRLPLVITTLAKRYEQDGWIWRPLKNLTLLVLYFMGWSSDRLATLYDRKAAKGEK